MKSRLLAFIILIFSGMVAFADSSPVTVLENSAQQLIQQLQKNKSKIRNNQSLVMSLVQRTILPQVDQVRMARSVVSRTIWDQANAKQQAEFIQQFRTLVLRTYAAAFTEYTNESVKFRPVLGNLSSQNDVTVSSIIVRPGRPSIPVDYSLTRKGTTWQVYDFTVDGVSMINSFRSQFNSLNFNNLQNLTTYLAKANQGKGA